MKALALGCMVVVGMTLLGYFLDFLYCDWNPGSHLGIITCFFFLGGIVASVVLRLIAAIRDQRPKIEKRHD